MATNRLEINWRRMQIHRNPKKSIENHKKTIGKKSSGGIHRNPKKSIENPKKSIGSGHTSSRNHQKFNANPKKSTNAAGWTSFRKNKERNASGISSDRFKKIQKELKNNNWNYIIEGNIYRTQKGQELWMNLGFPYVEKNSSLSKNEMRRYLKQFVYAFLDTTELSARRKGLRQAYASLTPA